MKVDNMPDRLRAKDIRKLRPCQACNGMGHAEHMVNDIHDWHTTCYREKFGMRHILRLPKEQLAKFRICDLTTNDMIKVLKKYKDLP